MVFNTCLEALLPIYKKHIAKKIIEKYEDLLNEYFISSILISKEEFKKYIFIDKIIEDPTILYKILIDFREEYLQKDDTKLKKNITLTSIYNDSILLMDFVVKIYETLKKEYLQPEMGVNLVLE